MVQGLLLPPGVLEIGLPTVMFGRPESGKSTLAILQAVALMSGRGKIIGIDGHLEPQPVGFIWAEEGWDILECKIAMILQEYGIDPGEIEGRCFDLTTAAEIRALFIDSLSAIAPEAEMDNAAASHTANGLVEICRAINGSALAIHHSRKQPPGASLTIGLEESRGASAVYGKARVVLQCEKTEGFANPEGTQDIFNLHTVKASNFRREGPKPYTVKPLHLGEDSAGRAVFVPVARMMDADEMAELADAVSGLGKTEVQGFVTRFLDVDRKLRRVEAQSDDWAGYAAGPLLPEPLDPVDDLGKGMGNKQQRGRVRNANRERVKQALDSLVGTGVLAIETVETTCPKNRTKKSHSCYVQGDHSITSPT